MLATDVSVHELFGTIHRASSPCAPHSWSSLASVLFNPPPMQGVGDGVAASVVTRVVDRTVSGVVDFLFVVDGSVVCSFEVSKTY